MNRKPNIILAAFLAVMICVCMLTGCGGEKDSKTEAPSAVQTDSNNIKIPGYESLSFTADKTEQSVKLTNPAENACLFRLNLIIDGETLWTSGEIKPGETVEKLNLSRALSKGAYPAVLKYECFTLQDKTPLNGAEIKLNIEVK